MAKTEESFGLVYPFFDDDPRFALGFEVGSIHARLKSGETIAGQLVHGENTLQLELTCAHFCDRGKYSIIKIDETWSELNAEPRNE